MPAPRATADIFPIRVCLMLKAPRPGLVKTRLAAEIGPQQAATVYRHLVEGQMRELPASWEVFVAFAPTDAEAEMRGWLGGGVSLFPQYDGDLGDRLAHAMRHIFELGDGPLFFLGGDCPSLTQARLTAAADALRETDCVLWPVLDGGYCLIGMNAPLTALFKNIAWSSARVLEQTLAAACGAGLTRVRLLDPPLEDVDDLPSWQRSLAGNG